MKIDFVIAMEAYFYKRRTTDIIFHSSFCVYVAGGSSFCLLGIVRASSVFPILSTILLLLGGLCVGAGRIYNSKNNIILSAGILFVAAGRL